VSRPAERHRAPFKKNHDVLAEVVELVPIGNRLWDPLGFHNSKVLIFDLQQVCQADVSDDELPRRWTSFHFRKKNFFSRERLRRVLRKKAAVILDLHTFTPADLDLHTFTPADPNLHTFTSANLHLHTFTPADLDLQTFTPADPNLQTFIPADPDLHIFTSADLDLHTLTSI